MKPYIKIWIEADRLMTDWQAEWTYYNATDDGKVQGRTKKRDLTKKEVLDNVDDHDEAQGMYVLNDLIRRGGELVATHPATCGGVCSGILAIVDRRKMKPKRKR